MFIFKNKVVFLFVIVSFVLTSQFLAAEDTDKKLNFLLKNVTAKTHMPKSFCIQKEYWQAINSQGEDEKNRNERVLATYGLNLYDGATWQIALALFGETEIASTQTQRLLSGKSGDITLRAFSSDFKYGDDQVHLPEDKSLFFRMISDEWALKDPLTGETVTWMDWKPIMGENAWAAMIGPLQVAYYKYGQNIPLKSDEVKLAVSILPALRNMQSPIGAVYHSPWGVYEKDPHDISSENNASLLAGLRMLKQVLHKGGDPNLLIPRIIDPMIINIESYFKNYAYDPIEKVLFQGGIYDPLTGQFTPSKDFAVDVQTWCMTVLGPETIDAWFGDGTAYQIWQNTKAKSGYYTNGILHGVGYTDDPNAILSVEWTLGAILLVRELYDFYQFPDLIEEASSMRNGVEFYKETVQLEGEATVAYDYASARYSIPFGWWANKVPSLTSTAWVLLIDHHFNPFILGGGF